MSKRKRDLNSRVGRAVKHFWQTRTRQGRKQGTRTGQRDYGNRTVATGGKQLDGFTALVGELLAEAGVPKNAIHRTGREQVTLPGFFRPTKQWDIVVVASQNLLAAIECKSLCGPSFGNNYNNRIEEALGNAEDVWTAYREGAFDEFRDASYGKRCEESIRKLVRERCYNAGCLMLSSRTRGSRGEYTEPASDLSFERFAKLLCNQVATLYRSLTDGAS